MSIDLTLSWIDLRISTERSELLRQFQNRYLVSYLRRYQLNSENSSSYEADVICFEYDYPDIPSLNLLQEVREALPCCPIVMFTEQHSEALAVWAFRTGVWDYFVLPLAENGIDEVFMSIEQATEVCVSQRPQFKKSVHVMLPDEVRFRRSPENEKLLQPAISYLEGHFREKITEERLALLCKISVSQFSRTFRQTFDVTFQEYLVRFRLNESARLLRNPSASIADIAYLVGFNDPSYYARAFKKHFGVTPSRYRQCLKGDRTSMEQSDQLLRTA
ncbi:response regulator transcription factor [uncultured Amphritea sp.]|uniref:helix-turn-helix transcriptional regulator n=1 Tax=uncultured Amphritea sp. TaxID=981605 RepID=UPI0025E0926F|nr:response regulator transcription factor [uncultured Amphritea sp.]